jgi:hypothetical protein
MYGEIAATVSDVESGFPAVKHQNDREAIVSWTHLLSSIVTSTHCHCLTLVRVPRISKYDRADGIPTLCS